MRRIARVTSIALPVLGIYYWDSAGAALTGTNVLALVAGAAMAVRARLKKQFGTSSFLGLESSVGRPEFRTPGKMVSSTVMGSD